MSTPIILFVDDEPLTRRMTVKVLEKKYRVETAQSVEEALVILDEHAGQIGVLITDLKMPGRDGMSLVSQVANDYPGISIVVSTGAMTLYDLEGLKETGVVFDVIEKPWDRETAMYKIGQAMEQYAGRTEAKDSG